MKVEGKLISKEGDGVCISTQKSVHMDASSGLPHSLSQKWGQRRWIYNGRNGCRKRCRHGPGPQKTSVGVLKYGCRSLKQYLLSQINVPISESVDNYSRNSSQRRCLIDRLLFFNQAGDNGN